MSTFKELNLSPDIQAALEKLNFITPTEIQKKAIPLLLAADKIDFHGQAQTGTGKTLAFGIPLLQRIERNKLVPQALIVAPTRELAVQIYDSINQVARSLGIKMAVIYGGVSMEEQIRTLRNGVHIVVGTPGRLNDHLRRKTLSVSQVRTLVLDEADIMLDMGFKDEVDEILSFLPTNREIWLFSATVKPGINDIIKKHMGETVSVRVSSQQIGTTKTKQYYCIVPFKSRLHAITRFIQSSPDFYGFIFCQTKMLTSEVAEQLIKRGYNVGALHGDMSQAQRNLIIKRFKQQEISIVVATDVAARGIDVANLTHVINYSIPEDLESYVHRIGRTGRAGKEGTAITFVSKSEQRLIHQIERKFNVLIQPIDVPSTQSLITTRMQEAREYVENLKPQENAKAVELHNIIGSLDPQKLIQVAVQLLYDKFLSTLDLEEIPFTHVDSFENNELQEISISVGLEEDVTKDQVIQFLTETGVVTEDQIKSIRILKIRTFVKLAGTCTPDLITALRGKSLAGRHVRVNLTCLVGGPERSGARRMGRERSGNAGNRRFGRDGGYSRDRRR